MRNRVVTALHLWMLANGKSTAELADIIGRERTRAHRIRHHAKLPNKEEAGAIETWTGGAIRKGSFYEYEEITGQNGAATPKRQKHKTKTSVHKVKRMHRAVEHQIGTVK